MKNELKEELINCVNRLFTFSILNYKEAEDIMSRIKLIDSSEPVKAESISDHKQKEKICDCYNGESYRDGYFGTFCTKCNGRLQS